MSVKSKDNDIDQEKQNKTTKHGDPDKSYNYDEAIDLAGTGGYNYTLLLTLSLTILSMGIDMFGFSVVVAGCSCDLQLDQGQKNILVSMPFVGAVIMSYPWGYVSDTQGRRKTLLIAMFGSFIVATISAFSPNWIALAICKFISTSLCSCAQSVTYALLGETCSIRARGTFMIIMTSMLMMCPAIYFVLGYLVLSLDFSYDMGIMMFLPWRLLVLVLALPFGICVMLLLCHYESPKFLVNADKEKEALEILKKIYRRNGGKDIYPVEKLILNEEGNTKRKNVSLLQSLWEQTAPLFKPPLLWRTLQLYFLIAVMYSSNNSFVMWYPFIVDMFFAGAGSTDDNGLCNMITSARNVTTATDDIICSPRLETQTVVSSVVYSVSFTLINLCLSRFASRKKLVMIALLAVSAVAGIGANLTTNSMASFVLFIAFLLTGLCIGFAFSFFIDLYPTSHRGMVTCLAVMVARASALGGTNLVGAFIMDYCTASMYAWCAYILSGVVVACFLPSDRPKAKETT